MEFNKYINEWLSASLKCLHPSDPAQMPLMKSCDPPSPTVTCPHLSTETNHLNSVDFLQPLSMPCSCVSCFCTYYTYHIYLGIVYVFAHIHVTLFLICDIIHTLCDYLPYSWIRLSNSLRSRNPFVHLLELFSTTLYTWHTSKHYLFIDLYYVPGTDLDARGAMTNTALSLNN